MALERLLSETAQIPYNSSRPDLPSGYDGSLRYGLDCFGFVGLLQQYNPDVEMLVGVYGKGQVHAAGVLDDHFVDPFLRMKRPVLISNSKQHADTYYSGSTVEAQLDSVNDIFGVEVKRGFRRMSQYTYDLNNQNPQGSHEHMYRYTFLNNGRPISVVKVGTLSDTCKVEVIGEEPDMVNKLLKNKFQLTIDDVAQMFFDADQNLKYTRSQSYW